MAKDIFEARIIENKEVAKGIYAMWLEAAEGDFPVYRPGHFIMLEPKKPGSVMWRPFSVFDFHSGIVHIVYEVKPGDSNTLVYSQLGEGETIKVTGPRGKAFELEDDVKHYVAVAGGAGVGGIGFIAKAARRAEKKTYVCIGTRRDDLLYGEFEFNEAGCDVRTITEDEEGGGYVIKLLDELLQQFDDEIPVEVVACGPPLMLDGIHEVVKKYGRSCYILPEEIMACRGTHSCKGCSIPLLSEEPFHICHDGFIKSSLVDMEAFTRRYRKEAKEENEETDKNFNFDPQMALKTFLQGPDGVLYEFVYPWGNAAGCLDVAALDMGSCSPDDFGFLLAKGERIEPKVGNPAHRVVEVPGGMMNSIGLEGDGIDAYISRKLPAWNRYLPPKIVNIWGSSPKEYAEVAWRLRKAGVRMVEVNLSCPNLNKRIPGKYGGHTYTIIQAIRKRCPDMFIIAKLTAMTSDIVEVGRSAYEAGANAISAINTLEGMDIDIETGFPMLGGVYAGLSGPAIYTVGLKSVHLLSKLPIPIIGCGGIWNAETAVKYFMAGATMIQVGTELFRNPLIMRDIRTGVSEYLNKYSISHVSRIKDRARF